MIFKSEKWQPHVWKNEAFCQKVQQCKSLQKKVFSKIIGSLSNDDGNGNENENGKKKMFLDWQNNNFARASCFFCTFLCCCCTTTMWKCLNSCFVENMNIRQRLYFSLTLIQSFYRIQLQKNLMNWMSWNKCNKVWSSINSLFKWRFHSRHSRCCLSSLIVIVAKVIILKKC